MHRLLSHLVVLGGLTSFLVNCGCAHWQPSWSPFAQASATVTSPAASTTAAPPAENSAQTRLVYKTNSDRLNVSTAAISSAELAAFKQPAGGIPSVTTCSLTMRHPHPLGTPDTSQAMLFVEPNTGNQESSRNWSSLLPAAIRPGERDKPQGPPPVEVWTFDIPKWQMDAIVKILRDDGFFLRSASLSSDATIGTEINGKKFGKSYRAIHELDSLILRARAQGFLVGGSARNTMMLAANAQPPQMTHVPMQTAYPQAAPMQTTPVQTAYVQTAPVQTGYVPPVNAPYQAPYQQAPYQ